MPSKTSAGTTLTPPTAISRSDSLVVPPATKAWAMTTEGSLRVARSSLTRPIAARNTDACERSATPNAGPTTAGSR